VDEVCIVDVKQTWVDYKVVETAFFGRQRYDGKPPSITRRKHELVKVRRIQNRLQHGHFQWQRRSMLEKRGQRAVEMTQTYAWHGSGKTRPDKIAADAGFMMLPAGDVVCGAGELQPPRQVRVPVVK
jgi:hypothetical protein